MGRQIFLGGLLLDCPKAGHFPLNSFLLRGERADFCNFEDSSNNEMFGCKYVYYMGRTVKFAKGGGQINVAPLTNFPSPQTNCMQRLSLNFSIWISKVIPFNTKNKVYQKPKSPKGGGDMSLTPPPPVRVWLSDLTCKLWSGAAEDKGGDEGEVQLQGPDPQPHLSRHDHQALLPPVEVRR